MKKLMMIAAAALLSGVAMADTKPINLSLTPDIAIQDRGDRIEGLTLSIWGENEQQALSLGLVNGSTGNSSGLSWGVINYADNFTGVQWGVVNYAEGNFTGWQGACVSYTEGEMHGLQTGWINYAGRLRGVQLGLLNYAESTVSGLQVGLLNVMPDNNEWFSDLPESVAPAMVIVNWRF